MQRQATPKFFSAAGKHTRKKRDRLKNFCIDYYPYGMPMPGRSVYSNYRYGYQGEFAETDGETGMPAFELRLWDARIGRWLTTDPYGEFFSPYLGMGNNPISLTDPDGGSTDGCCDTPWRIDQPNALDEVVLTGNRLQSWTSEVNSQFAHWQTSFEGNLEKWNKQMKKDFKTSEAAMEWWHKKHVADPNKEQWMDEFYAGMENMRMGAMNIINVATLPISVVETAVGLTAITATRVVAGSSAKALATYADDVVLYTSGAARAPKGGLYNLGTNSFNRGGTFLPRSSQPSLSFSRGAENVLYQTLPRVGSQIGYVNPAANATQIYFTLGLGGVHMVSAPYLLIRSK